MQILQSDCVSHNAHYQLLVCGASTITSQKSRAHNLIINQCARVICSSCGMQNKRLINLLTYHTKFFPCLYLRLGQAIGWKFHSSHLKELNVLSFFACQLKRFHTNLLFHAVADKPLPTNGEFKMHFPALRFWRTVADFDSSRESGYLLPNRRIDQYETYRHVKYL